MAEQAAIPTRVGAPALVGVENLTVHFRQGGRRIDALKDFNLTLREGEFVSLVGPSGCGKSTLLRVIAGLHKDFSGRLDIDPVLQHSSLGFVFQRDSLLPWKTVLANVATGLQIRGVGKRERTERARDLLHRVGLAGFEEAYPTQLSGGMRQRASVARTLIYEPRVILMDEPFGALDAQVKGQIQELFLSIWEDIRPGVVFVTHDLAEAIYLAERVVVLSGRPGRVRTELPVDLPRPRTSPFEIWRDEHYLSIHGELWESLKTEIGPS
ncbi:MAG TPA: ABC transporter ATP-binding protein [Pseudonocardiaceae bacterium]|jgi:NitT/TauT family transport system ATP-binding protein|nr:ABC transporter ATP-binding protein [Pseudonocardiaceae bacterium]